VILKRLRKFVVGLVTATLTFTGLVVTATPSQAALDASTFDPGLIISDSVFNDWGTMDAASIQKFLNARVPVCDDDDGGPKCLRNYKEDVVGSYAIRNSLHSYSLKVCADVPAAEDRTAAQIIASVAVACKINPRVLLVTLQKEQGLVSAKDPTTYMYKAAMGYGCPDSAPQICGQDSNSKSRLFWQMYRAAWQLKWYGDPRGSFTYLRPGTMISMGYNPKASCGRQTFKLKSQATAKLYYYTPYVPNKSALKNLWGSGDSCGAYGNRNFWRQFWTWFGSPVAGGYLLKSSTNETFLVNQDSGKRYLITQDSMISDFKPLGPIGTVSEAYLSSFTDAGELKSVVSDSAGKRYMIVDGFKYQVASSTQAASLGLDWATASALTDVQVDNFTNLAFGKSLTSGEIFLLDGSIRRLVASAELHKTLSVMGGTATFTDEFLNRFTLGSPATGLIQNAASARFGIFDGKKIQLANSAQATALGYDWNQATSISDPTLASIPSATFIKSTSTPFWVSGGRKHPLTSSEYSAISKFGSVATVSADTLSKFQTGPAMNGLIRTPSYTYLVTGGARYRIVQSQVTAVNNATGSRMDWANPLIATSEQAKTLSAPVMMKPTDSSQTYLVVDNAKKFPISASNAKHFSKLGAVGAVPASYLSTITSGVNPDRFVQGADGINYFLSESKKYRVTSAAVAKAFAPSSFPEATPTFNNLPELTATQLALYSTPSTSAVTTYVKSTTEKYLIQNGVRREVLDDASLTSVVGSVPATSVLTPAAVSHLPLGDPIYSEGSLLTNTDGSLAGIAQADAFFEVPKNMLADIKAGTAWQLNKSAGTLTNDSIAKLTRGSALAPFVSGGGQSYLLTGAGKTLISDPANIATTMNSIPTALLAKISATSAGTITTPLVVQSVEAPTKSFLVYSKKKRLLVNAGQEAGLLKIAGFQTKVTWPGYALDALKTTNNVFSPAQIVKVKESGNIYLIDGWDRGWALTLDQAKAFGVAAPPEITRTNFSGYKTSTRLASQKFVCGNRTYLAEAGKLIPIEAAAVAQWPGAVTTFAANTCANLRLETVQIGALVTYGSNKYQVDGGKLRLIRTAAEYTALSQNRVAAVVISKTMFNLIPKGNPTSYVVVAGDSLSRVAVKFKTTKTVLRTINNLATEVLQRGQVLILP
jgi:hypothetical protein